MHEMTLAESILREVLGAADDKRVIRIEVIVECVELEDGEIIRRPEVPAGEILKDHAAHGGQYVH